MKPDNLLDHALGQLDADSVEAADLAIARDPALALRSDRLQQALHRLLDDGDPFEVPVGLASRTVAFVADRRSRRAILDYVPARVPFRWADVAVAAGILMAGVLTLLPAVKSARDKMSQAGCGFNLQQLYAGLAHFASRHDHYPDVQTLDGKLTVGTYATQLHDESLLLDTRTLHCPCRGACPPESAKPIPEHIDYAYHVGYRDRKSGKAEPAAPRLGASIPVLADQPAHDDHGSILAGNSPNHGFRGQNVLFSDGHIQWFADRKLGLIDKDMFLNNEQKPEPGVGPEDVALVPAVFRVDLPRGDNEGRALTW